jgi:hypothetical protein
MVQKKFTRFSLVLVAFLTLGFVLAACGDTPAPAAPSNQKTALGYNSALASSFPSKTALYITLNTNEGSDQIKGWQNMVKYLSAIPEVEKTFSQIDIVKAGELGTYDADVRPWLGNEIAIGITDMEALGKLVNSLSGMITVPGPTDPNKPTPTPNPNTITMFGMEIPALVAFQVKDKAKAEAFVNKLFGKMGNNMKPTTETYNGYNLTNLNLFVAQLSVAVGNDRLFLGLGTKLVKDAIDQQAGNSLSANAQYKQVSGKIPASNLGFVYADASSASKLASSLPATGQTKPATTMNMDYLAGLGMSFATAEDGLRVDVYQTYNESKMPAEVKQALSKAATQSKVLEALPANTFFFATGQDAKSAYEQLDKTMAQLPADQSKQFKDQLAEFEAQTGLNIKNDLVSLLSGEFAIYGTPAVSSPDLPMGVGFVTAVSDKNAAQTSIDKILSSLDKSDKVTTRVENKTFNGVTYKSATVTSKDQTKKDKTMTLDMGVAGNYLFVSSAKEQTEATITAATGGANFKASNNAEFNKVKEYLPDNNQGYFFLDIQQAFKVANSATVPADKAADKAKMTDITAKLGQLKSVGGATRSSTTESASVIFVHFPVTK